MILKVADIFLKNYLFLEHFAPLIHYFVLFSSVEDFYLRTCFQNTGIFTLTRLCVHNNYSSLATDAPVVPGLQKGRKLHIICKRSAEDELSVK
jgi:hypothetical protein